MKRLSLFVFVIFVAGSSVCFAGIALKNRENLNRLSLGMEKAEVLQIMGTKTVKVRLPGSMLAGKRMSNPYKTEILVSKDGETKFEVLFYFTGEKKKDGAITDDELSPLVFLDGKLEGWGWTFMDDATKKFEIRFR